MGNIGIWQLLIVAVIIVLLFGTKKLRNVGGDLGSAIRSFKKAVKEEPEQTEDTSKNTQQALENNQKKDADFEQHNPKSKDKV